ncbi:YdcF family protein [Pseudomonadota bacterium]
MLRPSALFAIAAMLAFVMLFNRKRVVAGRRLLGLALLGLIGFAILPGGAWMLGVLEDRFPVPDDTGAVAGIIVLGGSVNTLMSEDRGQIILGDGAERLTEFMRLGRAHPDAKLVFSGGIGLLSGEGPTEANITERFFVEQGFDVGRVWFEDASRNTVESAKATYQHIKPQPGERWLLVTSARHMPRAMGLFRHAGWDAQAYPVDYYTSTSRSGIHWPPKLGYVDTAVYEWGGLITSWLRGRIDGPFPGPRAMAQE